MMQIIQKEYIVEPLPMKCGSYEAEKRTYKLILDKNNRKWLVANEENEADNIYVEGGKNSDGFAGRTLTFSLITGEKIKLQGPWHTNSNSLYEHTGYDCRNKSFTFGLVAKKREMTEDYKNKFIDIFYIDNDWTLGLYDRIEIIAQQIANELNDTVYYYRESQGGSSSGPINPNTE